VVVPSALLSQDEGVAIDALRTETGESWMQLLRKDVERVYNKLSEEERSLVDSRILNPIYLVEPYIRVVLTQLTNGAVLEDDAFMAFQSTDDHRWSIGFGNFVQEGMAYRLIVQFNLSYDGLTAVTVERGYSEIDVLYNGLNRFVRSNSFAPPSPYFELSLSQPEFPANGWGLGKNGIVVNGHDRQLGTLDVTLNAVMPDGTFRQVDLTVPGTHMDDRSGYLRQLRGERYEFVPAHMVKLYGKETVMAFFVEADGTIGRISQLTFKGALTLCEGPRPDMNLSIRYGDDIRRKLKVWQQDVGEDVYRDCELVFNYSPNGNLLDEVVSVRNKIAFWTIAERASTASIWK
jgi:hypothetical protein